MGRVLFLVEFMNTHKILEVVSGIDRQVEELVDGDVYSQMFLAIRRNFVLYTIVYEMLDEVRYPVFGIESVVIRDSQ